MSQAGLNRVWAQALLETLYVQGVRHICIAPGSRSTPLSLEALELAERTDLTIHTHFDERGLGYLALGLAKASDEPVAVIVTSGTAVANLLPCAAESGLTGEKLVLLTADRPQELIDVGANQAIQQKGIFSTHVIKSVALPSPSVQHDLGQALISIQQALAYQDARRGSVHINCPYPEPLYIQSHQEKEQYLAYFDVAKSVSLTNSQLNKLYTGYNVAELTNCLQQEIINRIYDLKTVVVIGKMPLEESIKVKAFAEKFGWPILCDPQSGVSSDWAHFDLWLQVPRYADLLSEAECVLQFGARLVSKRLGQWIKQVVTHNASNYWVFDPTPSVLNPDHLPQLRTVATISECIDMLDYSILPANEFLDTTSGWAEESKLAGQAVQWVAQSYKKSEHLTECQLALRLDAVIDILLDTVGPTALFIGNSLIVRLVDMLSTIENIEVYTNRGASGIDGLIATAVGVQRQKQQAMLTLIGDTSLLYDLNSLALLSKTDHPHIVIVTNNDGGAIFDLLPVPAAQKQTLYQMPHGFQFEFAAKQFGLYHQQPTSMSQCLEGIRAYLEQYQRGVVNSALIVEILTPPEQASQHIKTIVQAVKSHAL
ncbi:2-succinyl-5-enolpyruvyl-6-hydroxy-3-cyclohexene-1-carboxylic-acid synthase [Vibrio rumoiensis]|uniref:2-succinyl-5-enolpyruvyl-6-hydroxy-3-cyclohexene-1-carboxylate synthase n=1 Tax=Vibrio rumoiensis 1S-45 TaxID=1188252 RepID=A0A1E5E3P1_9VIBR|nr:2-succinyl-5-enolpyruvyl-6-hydroxy-3-cyclohexene-1-carboxylic-acid synthase [Vibrio rumoiensis]OEF26965.1 2-succinyl-5-enolpyruvyl-6-hydroxy-3-cyclohexene-1-carboxylic-acid synthase [Vibrio rumoiensis 1S-45]